VISSTNRLKIRQLGNRSSHLQNIAVHLKAGEAVVKVMMRREEDCCRITQVNHLYRLMMLPLVKRRDRVTHHERYP
jgi:hypothetical protein